MKIKVMFDVPDKYKTVARQILAGHDIIWGPSHESADILLINNDEYTYTPNIKMIQTLSAGVDHLNLEKIKGSTILCSNAGAYAISVAEHCFALILSVAKKILTKVAETKMGVFKQEPTTLLYNKKLGIIGYGGIGKRVAHLAKAFNMNVIAFGRASPDKNVDQYITKKEELPVLLSSADIIVISIPLTKFTKNMISVKELKLLKDSAILVNVARPEIVNKQALLDHLNTHPNLWYLADVWWNEPNIGDANIKNVILTPHIAGGKSGEIMEYAYIHAFENIKRFIDKKTPRNIVNISEYEPGRSTFLGV